MSNRGFDLIEIILDNVGTPNLHVICDCGQSTNVVIEELNIHYGNESKEFAYTCDSCGSVHWITIEKIYENE